MYKFKKGWHLIYTRPRQEKKLGTQLQERDIAYYLPTIRSLRTWHDRKKFIDMPLFPSYVFVYLPSSQHYFDAMKNEGFLCYVKSGKDIVNVREKTIDEIKFLLSHGSDIEVTAHCNFQPGKQVMICNGPFTGIECEVIKYNNKEKILVSLNLIQRSILATIPVEYLSSASA
jgi:transcription antitermination factor NusG